MRNRYKFLLSLPLILIVTPIIPIITSCGPDKDDPVIPLTNPELYYRNIATKGNLSVSVDISLFEVDFNPIIDRYPNLQGKLDSLNANKPYLEEPWTYVGERSFSFMGAVDDRYVDVGTAWVVASDPESENKPYRYWMMSNRHVTDNWLKSGDSYKHVLWNTIYDKYDEAHPSWASDDYHCLPENSVKIAPEKVDAINPNLNSDLLLTKFFNGTYSEIQKIYSAGFPWTDNPEVASWQQANSQIYAYDLTQSEPQLPEGKNFWIGEASYVFNHNSFLNMKPGSSGSVIVDPTTNKVIGIYWGGYGSIEKNNWYPCGAIFNTSGHDNTKKWEEYNKLDAISTIVGAKIY